jgi:hypothetical protein
MGMNARAANASDPIARGPIAPLMVLRETILDK